MTLAQAHLRPRNRLEPAEQRGSLASGVELVADVKRHFLICPVTVFAPP